MSDREKMIWWRGCIFGASVVGLLWIGVAHAAAQTAPSATPQPAAQQPAAYNFTFTSEGVDALYGALERANQVQMMVTGDRSARWDQLQSAIRDEVQKQKEAVARAAATEKKMPELHGQALPVEPKMEAKP